MSKTQELIWILSILTIVILCTTILRSDESIAFFAGTIFCTSMWYVAGLFDVIVSDIRKKIRKK